MKDRSNEITLEEALDLFVTFRRSEIVMDVIKECENLHEKMVLLCMAIDAIAHTEGITHEEMYKMLDETKPIIEAVNKEFGKGGIVP